MIDYLSVKNLLERMRGTRILVAGDVILDRFVLGEVARISREAPVPVLKKTREYDVCGGASNAAANARSLGGDVALVGVVGPDEEGKVLGELLEKAGVEFSGVVDRTRQTPLKIRYTHKNQQLLRVDRETREPLRDEVFEEALDAFVERLEQADAVVLSDYGLGFFSREHARSLIGEVDKRGIPLVVDPRPPNGYLCESSFVFVPGKADGAVMAGMASMDDPPGEGVAMALAGRFNRPVILTDGPNGMFLCEPGSEPVHIISRARSVYDVSGAGDTVTAAVALVVGTGGSLLDAALLANEAAGAVVSKFGTSTVHPEEILRRLAGRTKIVSWSELEEIVNEVRKRGSTVVFTNGCFDLLHVGHIRYLRTARDFGDVLIVALNSDSSVRRLKGADRPLIAEKQRAELLASLEFVDYVTVFDDDTPEKLLLLLKPDVFVKGGDYTEETLPEAPLVRSYGGAVRLVPLFEGGISTTRIIKKISESSSD